MRCAPLALFRLFATRSTSGSSRRARLWRRCSTNCLSIRGVAVSWAQTLKEVPDGPAIVIGNEFLDALPVRQFVRVNGQWRERTVRVNGDGALVFDVADKAEPYIRANAANGEILEVNPSGASGDV